MIGFNNDLLRRLGRFALSLVPQFLEKAYGKKAPRVTVVQTRKTLTNTKTTKQTKGE